MRAKTIPLEQQNRESRKQQNAGVLGEAIHENFDALKRKRIVQCINPPENRKGSKKVI